jgi:hypothetical protein
MSVYNEMVLAHRVKADVEVKLGLLITEAKEATLMHEMQGYEVLGSRQLMPNTGCQKKFRHWLTFYFKKRT